MDTRNLLKEPSALAPVLMSVAALGIVGLRIVVVGTARAPDEGAAAHLWQVLMVFQIPVIIVFALKWFPREPRRSALVFGIQVLAALAAAAPVFMLHW
jgi:hypothetical protein